MFILPINRDLDTDSRPYALISILALNAVVLVAMYVSGNSTHIYREYGFIPVHPHLLNLLTSMFLHAGFWHLAGNAWFLWMFGKEVESSVGPGLFVLIYLACGFGGGLLHYALNSSSPVPCVGASGAISGIAGFFFVLFPRADFDLVFYFGWIRLGRIESHTTAAVGAWIGEQTLLGLLSQAWHFSSTAFWAHVGGFATGLVAAFCFKTLIPLDSKGMPINRPWFIPSASTEKPIDSRSITELKL